MDARTAAYYAKQAEKTADLYNSAEDGVSRYFESSFPGGASVLDIGCGSGRDLNTLLDMGYRARGVDSSKEMIDAALKAFPLLTGLIAVASIPYDGLYFHIRFDCILCSALLMHIEDYKIDLAASTIQQNLRPGGRLLISVPLKREDIDRGNRAPDGRLFLIRSMNYYDRLFEKFRFNLISWRKDGDSLGRSGIVWGTGLYTLEEK